MTLNRRHFLVQAAGGVALGGAVGLGSASRAADGAAGGAADGAARRPLIVSTWAFGRPANDVALKVLQNGGSELDAVEQGIRSVEDSRNSSVGLSGIPNAAGVVQLDACIMTGAGFRAGSVAALEGIRHPITAARRVMEKTPHVMLAGEGARLFALQEGLESVESSAAEKHQAWHQKRIATNPPPSAVTKPGGATAKPSNHDTIALLVLGANGELAGGCSTSGWGGKLPGRVGDSPIIGGGLYVDNAVGAAGATGLGENILRYCGSFLVVEFMRQGMSPDQACLEVVRRIVRQDPKGAEVAVNFIALDKQGRFGAAGSAKGFQYAVATRDSSRVLTSAGVGRIDIGPEGGNRK